MNSAGVISQARPEQEVVSCRQCGSTSRVGRGLCLNCLLYRGLGEETYDSETLESVLDEIDVRDADWRLGNYQILEEIDRGGMGVIYRARQRHSRRIVALKRILAHHADSHDTLVRFRREAEAAASLDHPNILPIYEVSEGQDGLPFFSMKFAASGSLLENQAALRSDTRRAIGLMAKVSRAVEYAHSRGILHRDLKPGNILLDGRGEPLVSDFGLAKWLDVSSDLTRTLTIFGTPGYIAPEQAHGPAANLKPTADIYSLGAILFDLIAGRPPFLGEHALSVIEQAREKPAPKLRTIVPKVDRDLETICTRCLEREPDARYRSAADLAEDLERWLDGRPVGARPVSAPVRVWRWTRRNPKLASSVAGSILGGIAITIFAILTIGPNAHLQSLPPISGKSVAVLPFQNLSDDKADTYLTDGVQDEILNDLARVADLKVISRTSVMRYGSHAARNLREIATALRVAHVVEGTVQRVGDRVRVSAQLIDARNDVHLWGESYDRQISDVFALESELAQQVVSKLKAKLSPEEKAAIEKPPTADLNAYELYTRAKALIANTSFNVPAADYYLEAVKLLEDAVSRDPSFLQAYCKLAYAHDQIYSIGRDHTEHRVKLAETALDNAFRIRPESGEAHLALAHHLTSAYRDRERALSELDLARRTLPNEPEIFRSLASIQRRMGKWEQSNANFERALALDPRNVGLLQQLSLNYRRERRFPEMLAILDQVLKISPGDIPTQIARATVELKSRANPKPLHLALNSIMSISPSATESLAEARIELALYERDFSAAKNALDTTSAGCRASNFPFPHSWCVGVVARAAKDEERARFAFKQAKQEIQKITEEQKDYAEALCVLGLIEASLGEKALAIQHGRKAVELTPLTLDAIGGADMIKNLALIYAWCGEKKLATEQLEIASRIPSDISYGDLRLHPFWDTLRGDPQFEKIVKLLAPKAN